MNPIQQTPAPNPDVDETTGPDDPLDSLLTQLINGFFVLTDGQGAVSKWSEPAELLFGLEAAEVLGKGLFDTLVDHAPADAEAWRRFLESGEAPRTRAQQNVSAIFSPDKRTFPLEMVFIPVKLDEGFDFSLFLEDLSFELPRNLMLMRMRQQHPVVVRALRQALETEPQPWDGWRTAGTLVAFRPLESDPVGRRRARRPRGAPRRGRPRDRGDARSRSRDLGRLDRRPRRRRRGRRPPALRAGAHRGPREDRRRPSRRARRGPPRGAGQPRPRRAGRAPGQRGARAARARPRRDPARRPTRPSRPSCWSASRASSRPPTPPSRTRCRSASSASSASAARSRTSRPSCWSASRSSSSAWPRRTSRRSSRTGLASSSSVRLTRASRLSFWSVSGSSSSVRSTRASRRSFWSVSGSSSSVRSTRASRLSCRAHRPARAASG